MPWCFPVFPLKLLVPRRFRDCCYVLTFGAWWRLVAPRVFSAFFFFFFLATLVFVDVSHGVLILLSLSLCVVLLGVEGFGKPKKLLLLLCLPRILEHVFPFSNFPLLTSLGFVFKSCYPLIRSMFFANSLWAWEPPSSRRWWQFPSQTNLRPCVHGQCWIILFPQPEMPSSYFSLAHKSGPEDALHPSFLHRWSFF